MLFGRRRAAGIFNQNQIKSQLPGVARRGFDADVGGYSAQNDGVDAATAKLQLEVSAVKSAPLTFSNFDIAFLFFQRERVGPPVFR